MLIVTLIISDIPNMLDMRRVLFTYLHLTMTQGVHTKDVCSALSQARQVQLKPGGNTRLCLCQSLFHFDFLVEFAFLNQNVPLWPCAALRVFNPKCCLTRNSSFHPARNAFVSIPLLFRFTCGLLIDIVNVFFSCGGLFWRASKLNVDCSNRLNSRYGR